MVWWWKENERLYIHCILSCSYFLSKAISLKPWRKLIIKMQLHSNDSVIWRKHHQARYWGSQNTPIQLIFKQDFHFLSKDYSVETDLSGEQVNLVSTLTRDVVATVSMALPPLKRKRVAEDRQQKRPLFSAISWLKTLAFAHRQAQL